MLHYPVSVDVGGSHTFMVKVFSVLIVRHRKGGNMLMFMLCVMILNVAVSQLD